MVIYLQGGVCVCVLCVSVCVGGKEQTRVCVCVLVSVWGGKEQKRVCVCVSGKKFGFLRGRKVGWNEIYLKINTAPLNPIFIPFYICITKYLTTND